MDIEKAYPTHEIGRGPKNLKLFLARNRHGLEAIRCSTFYYAETNTSILFLAVFLCKSADNTLAVLAVHEFNGVLAWENGNTLVWKCNQDLVSLCFLLLNHSHEIGIHFE